MTLSRSTILGALLLGSALPLLAQQSPEAFVRDAVERNLGVQGEALALARSAVELRRTGALRLPTLSLEVQHVELAGGADIGELVNPAFVALNELTASTAFPTDLSFRFPLRQDARVRLSLPLFDGQIGAARGAARATRDAQAGRLDVAERNAATALRIGLLQHAAAVEVVRLREAVLGSLEEQLRAAERRAVEGLDAPDVVLRARADRSEGEQLLLEARQAAAAVRRAVNRQARRALDAAVPVVSDTTWRVVLPADLDDAVRQAMTREDLEVAEAGIALAEAGVAAARAQALPTIRVAADYGFQGDRWRFTGANDLAQLTVQGSWQLFQSGRARQAREAAALEVRRAELAREDAADRIRLEVTDAWDALATARTALGPAGDRARAATRTHELVRRRWDEGLASHLELVSARAAATAAEVAEILARYTVAERALLLARAIATDPFIP